MSEYLATFIGAYGDIIWSLATAKYISERIVGKKIDFAMAAPYASLIPLIEKQSYIDRSFSISDWDYSREGWINVYDNRWKPPEYVESGYKKAWHLMYRKRRCFDEESIPAIDYIARQQGIKLVKPIPFINIDYKKIKKQTSITWAFGLENAGRKTCFIECLKNRFPKVPFIRTDVLSWELAVSAIQNSICFVGCRSSNFVLAHAVGKEILCFEPHPLRSAYGYCGEATSCPYGKEITLPIGVSIQTSVEQAAKYIRGLL